MCQFRHLFQGQVSALDLIHTWLQSIYNNTTLFSLQLKPWGKLSLEALHVIFRDSPKYSEAWFKSHGTKPILHKLCQAYGCLLLINIKHINYVELLNPRIQAAMGKLYAEQLRTRFSTTQQREQPNTAMYGCVLHLLGTLFSFIYIIA